jgi:hypothetical protein
LGAGFSLTRLGHFGWNNRAAWKLIPGGGMCVARQSPVQAAGQQARMVFPAIAAVVSKVARIQSQVDMGRMACALERFKLAHGN